MNAADSVVGSTVLFVLVGVVLFRNELSRIRVFAGLLGRFTLCLLIGALCHLGLKGRSEFDWVSSTVSELESVSLPQHQETPAPRARMAPAIRPSSGRLYSSDLTRLGPVVRAKTVIESGAM